MTRKILDVGQCDADHFRIAQTLGRRLDIQMIRAHSAREALQIAGDGTIDLVLVNRLLDADRSEGMDVVRALKTDSRTASIPVMLVSNYEEAQASAEKAGALRGFGKDSLGDPATLERVAAALDGQVS